MLSKNWSYVNTTVSIHLSAQFKLVSYERILTHIQLFLYLPVNIFISAVNFSPWSLWGLFLFCDSTRINFIVKKHIYFSCAACYFLAEVIPLPKSPLSSDWLLSL